MDDLFARLGFSPKEAAAYAYLLQNPDATAATLAKGTNESRTNTYMILDRLVAENLVTVDKSKTVQRYSAADPVALKQRIADEQVKLRDINARLNQVLPDLKSRYNLGKFKPGVVYLEGIDGLKIMLDDMAHSKQEALIIPSGLSYDLEEPWRVLQEGVNKRAKLGVKSRIIFPETLRKDLEYDRLKGQGMTIRFWGEREYPGELVVYGDKCVFTVYHPSVINTILTDKVIAQSMRMLFEDLWEQAKP